MRELREWEEERAHQDTEHLLKIVRRDGFIYGSSVTASHPCDETDWICARVKLAIKGRKPLPNEEEVWHRVRAELERIDHPVRKRPVRKVITKRLLLVMFRGLRESLNISRDEMAEIVTRKGHQCDGTEIGYIEYGINRMTLAYLNAMHELRVRYWKQNGEDYLHELGGFGGK